MLKRENHCDDISTASFCVIFTACSLPGEEILAGVISLHQQLLMLLLPLMMLWSSGDW